MDQVTYNDSWSLKKFEREGVFYLGIPVRSNVKKYFLDKLSEYKKSNGWIVKEHSITEWKIEGIYSKDDHSYFYGAYHQGRLLREVLKEKPGDWINILQKLTTAYSFLTGQGIPHFRIYTMSVYFLDEGGILFLPPDIIEEIIALGSAEMKLEQKNLVNHPYLQGEAAVSYTLGVLGYRALTQTFPFSAITEDEIRYQIRNKKLLPLHLSVPGLKKEEAQFILTALCQTASTPPHTLKEWITRLELWQKSGLYEEISKDETVLLQNKAREKTRSLEKKYQQNIFFFRYKWIMLTITVVVLTLMLITGTSIYNIHFKPRTTKDFSPLQIVQAYYKSITTIDFYTLEDCIVGKNVKEDVNEIVNIYVITKQQSALNMEKPTIDPDEWTRRGRPQLRPGLLLYGISGLAVKELAAAPEPVFEAEYEKWHSEFDDENRDLMSVPHYYCTQYKDRLYLKTDRGGWVIYRLDREKLNSFEYKPD